MGKQKKKRNGEKRAPRKTTHVLAERNGTKLTATVGVITLAMDDLRGVYIDDHHRHFDEITSEIDAMHREAMESKRSEWTDIDAADCLVKLLAAIETAEGVKELQDSEIYKTVHDRAQPLTSIMYADGKHFRFTKCTIDLKLHTQRNALWCAAIGLNVKGDVAKYLDEKGTIWPRIGGNAARNVEAIHERVEILSQFKPSDVGILCEMAEAHHDAKGALTEDEEGN